MKEQLKNYLLEYLGELMTEKENTLIPSVIINLDFKINSICALLQFD